MRSLFHNDKYLTTRNIILSDVLATGSATVNFTFQRLWQRFLERGTKRQLAPVIILLKTTGFATVLRSPKWSIFIDLQRSILFWFGGRSNDRFLNAHRMFSIATLSERLFFEKTGKDCPGMSLTWVLKDACRFLSSHFSVASALTFLLSRLVWEHVPRSCSARII